MATHRIHMLLDRSGSMSGWRQQTVDAVNAYLEAVRADALARDTDFSLTVFDSESIDTVRRDEPGNMVRALAPHELAPRAATPLYDAMAWVLDHESRIPVSGRRAIVVVTDGEENGSRRATAESVRRFVEGREREGWAFIFLGANQDAQVEAAKVGVPAGRAISYRATSGQSAIATFAAAAAVTFAVCMLAPGVVGAAAAGTAFSDSDRQAAFDGAIDWQTEMQRDIAAAPAEPAADGAGWAGDGNDGASLARDAGDTGSAVAANATADADAAGSEQQGDDGDAIGLVDAIGNAANVVGEAANAVGEAIGSIFSIFGSVD